MFKRHEFRAYPTATQARLFAQTFGSTRFVFNKYVETNVANGKLVSFNQASKNLTALKKQHVWLKDVSSVALQQTLKDATQGVNNFFRNPKKVKPPKFKKRGNRQSFRIVGEKDFKVVKLNGVWGGVTLPKAGVLKFKQERELPTQPTSVTVTKTPSGEYYVSFVVEVETKKLPVASKNIGIDVGLTDYATMVDTNGVVSKIANPRYYRNAEKKLAKLQQEHSRKVKGSNNREKQRVRVAKQHAKVVNQRKDFIRKLVNVVTSENQTIITETLRIENMVKNHNLAKSIMDASWGMFLTQLSQKAEETGREHIKVDPFFPSSKTCNKCGTVKETLSLSERTWVCECGATHDRDINACLNLLAVGSTERINSQSTLLGTTHSKLLV